jgi:hypothetical protein
LANATQEWALADPSHRVPLQINGYDVDASRPRHTPVEGLDLATGYQIAAAAIRGLTKRLQTGAGSTTKYSLARTASLLTKAGPNPAGGPDIRLPLDGPWEDRVYGSPLGPVKRMVFPIGIEGAPLFWDKTPDRPGAAAPVWNSSSDATV